MVTEELDNMFIYPKLSTITLKINILQVDFIYPDMDLEIRLIVSDTSGGETFCKRWYQIFLYYGCRFECLLS
jgi:hypothetical protein